MKLFAAHDGRLAILERKVGLFAFAGLGALLLVFALIAVEQGIFASTTKFRFQTDDAGAIHQGLEVRLSGFKVGKIQGISLREDGAVEVQFFVGNKYLMHIHRGAKVRLVEQGLLGGGVLEIIPGPKGQPDLSANEMVPFERQFGMGELAHELVDRLKPILDNVQVTTKSLNGPDGLIDHARKVAVRVEETGEDVSSLLKTTQSAIAEENARLGKALDKSSAAIEKMGTLLENVNEVAKDVKKVTASSAENVPAMLRETSNAAEDTHNIINSAKDAWPLRNIVQPEGAKMLPMDSYGDTNAKPK